MIKKGPEYCRIPLFIIPPIASKGKPFGILLCLSYMGYPKATLSSSEANCICQGGSKTMNVRIVSAQGFSFFKRP